MNNVTVLVVDDESRMRKLIKDFLLQKEFQVLEAEDGEKALGVDEYISKPFSPKILVARVEAILNRARGNQSEVKDYGGIEINVDGRTVKVEGKEVEMSLREYELLKYLVDNEGIALSRDKILNNVWNYDYYGDSRTIDSHIKKIRHKLGKKGKYIETMRGIGYKFEVKK